MAILRSKKFQAALVGVLVAILGEVGLDLDAEQLLLVLSPILTYIGSQGLADIGKGKAQVEQNGNPD